MLWSKKTVGSFRHIGTGLGAKTNTVLSLIQKRKKNVIALSYTRINTFLIGRDLIYDMIDREQLRLTFI